MNLQKRLIAQFHHPKGLLGVVAGRIMANRESNLARNRWTVDLLELQPDDRVLELGPGPGVTLAYILEQIPHGRAVAVDHSKAMLAQCKRVNRRAVKSGQLKLINAGFTQLPDLPGPFDKIIAVNALQFDGMHKTTLKQITQHLQPGGRFAVTFQPRGSAPTQAKALAFAEKVACLMRAVGLDNIRIEELPMQPVSAMCVVATNKGLVI